MRKRSKKNELDKLRKALTASDGQDEGKKTKKWTERNIKTIKPMTINQEEMFHSWINGLNICAHGSAGTGKTFLAFFLALQAVLERREQNRIIVVRSAVATRDIGFLPGTLEEKVALYETPYHDICYELLGKSSSYDDLKECGMIEFMPTSFVRGLTWDNAVIIVDEAQNMNFHEIDSIMTRIGQNTRIIVTGDMKQTDLESKKNTVANSGLGAFVSIVKNMKEFNTIQFTVHDIVRSALVKSWIIAAEGFK